jgi:hypothetical protein
MSLREFPGLLRQLPHHKPWMITISVISVVVVLATCGFGSILLLKDEGEPYGQPSDGPVMRREISTREIDNVPLTVADVFPVQEIVAEPGVPPYTMIGEPQAGDECGVAGDGEVKRLLSSSDCTQFVRASFNSYDDRYFVTAGILNLADVDSATAISNQVKSLVETEQGRLTGYVSDSRVNLVLQRAAPRLVWAVRGHFLLYAVIVRKDGADIPADDQGARVVADDMLQRYLLDTVIDNWTIAKGTVSPTADPSTTTTPSTAA